MFDFVAHTFITDAVLLNLFGVVVCTVYGGLNSEWDTISDMITSDDKLRNGFAVYLVLSAILIFSVVYIIINRANVNIVVKSSVYVLYFVFLLSYIGFGIVSTDTDTKTHTLLAIVSFTCLLLITAIFIYAQLHVLYPSRTLTMAVYITAVGAGVLWLLTDRYYWEYVIVVALHMTWLAVAYVCDSKHQITPYRCHTSVDVVDSSE